MVAGFISPLVGQLWQSWQKDDLSQGFLLNIQWTFRIIQVCIKGILSTNRMSIVDLIPMICTYRILYYVQSCASPLASLSTIYSNMLVYVYTLYTYIYTLYTYIYIYIYIYIYYYYIYMHIICIHICVHICVHINNTNIIDISMTQLCDRKTFGACPISLRRGRFPGLGMVSWHLGGALAAPFGAFSSFLKVHQQIKHGWHGYSYCNGL